jgi:hypothetical protein
MHGVTLPVAQWREHLPPKPGRGGNRRQPAATGGRGRGTNPAGDAAVRRRDASGRPRGAGARRGRVAAGGRTILAQRGAA